MAKTRSIKVEPFQNKNQAVDSLPSTSDKKYLRDELCQFTETTSLHGIRYVGKMNIAAFRRLIWAVLITSSIVVLTFTLYQSLVTYYSYPVNTLISISRYKKLEFPAVTLCNYNSVRKSQTTDEEKYFIDNNLSPDFNFTKYNDWNLTDILYRVSHPIEDMLMFCTWQSFYPCGPANFTTHIYDFGICYTFNGIGERPTLNVTNAGMISGLYLQLMINQSEYTFSRYTAAGIRMMIHAPQERPRVATFGFSVSPGFQTQVALRGVMVKNLKKPYLANCSTQALKYSKVYTESLCIEECRFDYIASKCGCKHSTMLGEVPECTLEETFKCAFPADDRFVSDNVTCDCPTACEYTVYNPRISSTIWPSNAAMESMKTGYTMEYIRENMLEVIIYFEELSFEITQQVPAISRLQIFSEIGGNMGLLCGMSLITIFEFFEFFMLTSIQRIFNKH